jgi:hypothetical protein
VAYGPIPPSSVSIAGTAGRAFGGVYAAAASTGVQYQSGILIKASIASDTTAQLLWEMPWGALPTGTPTLILWARANATANSAKVNPKIVMAGSGDNPAALAHTAEGVQTLTWAAGDADEFKKLELTLDAVTIEHSKWLSMLLVFETASWTLAVNSLWVPRFAIV